MSRQFVIAGIVGLMLLVPARAQRGPLPAQGPAPLLHVRFQGPRGMHVTLYQGQAPGRDYAAPAAAGLRPGYAYRVRLHGMTDFPDVALYPSVEVRGTLELPPGINAENYPAPITLTETDIRSIEAGTLVTKVIFLEHPDRAAPIATTPGQPLEADLPPRGDLLEEARAVGRPVAIVRIGERMLTPEELAASSVPGTILLAGEKVLGRPAQSPWLPWACVRVYDPILGRRHAEEECLHDGGDVGRPAGIGPDGKLGGLDPTDSVAEYTDVAGRRLVAKSNRICICVPRFAILRRETPLAGLEHAIQIVSAGAIQSRAQLQAPLPTIETAQANAVVGIKGQMRPSGTQNVVGLIEVANTTTISVIGRMEGLDVIGTVVERPEQQLPPRPLVLCKTASTSAAKVGDIITFTLKYSNHGGQPISDIAINDSLSGRLEYVPGSAKWDRDTVFTTQANEAGSLILRWEVTGKLPPGESGVVSFQARVR